MIADSNLVGKYLISCNSFFDSIQSWIGNNDFILLFIDIRYRHCTGMYVCIYIYIYTYTIYMYIYTISMASHIILFILSYLSTLI